MYSLKSAIYCAGWNLYSLRKNARFYLCLLLGFLMCWMLTDRTISISRTYRTNIGIFEPFIWCFADSDGILYTSLTLILLMAEFPRMDIAESYLTFRAHRLPWLMGQVLTVFIITFGFCLFMLLSSMALCMGGAILDNRWSETATMLSFSPATFESALTVTRKTVKGTLPYQCVGQIWMLMFQYVLLLSMIQVAMAILKNKRTGVCIVGLVSLAGFVLTPERFMTWLSLPSSFQYYANLLSAWCSPLQHATYIMHSFGYDSLPRLWVSHAMMGSISLLLFTLAFMRIKKYDFQFSGGGSYAE